MPRRRKMLIKPCVTANRNVRSLAHQLGYRFRLFDTELPGVPHLVSRSRKTILFTVDCHAYRHAACEPTTQRFGSWYYKDIQLNSRELEIVQDVLRKRNWRCEVIWDCEAKDAAQLKSRLNLIFRK